MVPSPSGRGKLLTRLAFLHLSRREREGPARSAKPTSWDGEGLRGDSVWPDCRSLAGVGAGGVFVGGRQDAVADAAEELLDDRHLAAAGGGFAAVVGDDPPVPQRVAVHRR